MMPSLLIKGLKYHDPLQDSYLLHCF